MCFVLKTSTLMFITRAVGLLFRASCNGIWHQFNVFYDPDVQLLRMELEGGMQTDLWECQRSTSEGGRELPKAQTQRSEGQESQMIMLEIPITRTNQEREITMEILPARPRNQISNLFDVKSIFKAEVPLPTTVLLWTYNQCAV